ncbi:MAG: hypothetical protein KKB74_02720 [Bacteroidetes bacterium]|nr:hypothetical protein [Bacteroidota bacterium]
MFSFFSKLKKKPLQKNSAFYYRENQIQNVDDLKTVFNKKATVITNHPILYQGLNLDKILAAEREKQFAEESFMIDHNEVIPGHLIFFYKKSVEKYTLVMQLHFINDTFFFANTKVGSESLVSDKEKQKISNQLLHHYPDVIVPNNTFEYEFKDTQGNIISTKDHIYLYISYYANSSAVDKLRKIIENSNFAVNSGQTNGEKLENFL